MYIPKETRIIMSAYDMAHKGQISQGEARSIEVNIKSGDDPRVQTRGKFMQWLEKDLLPSRRQ